MKDGDMVYLLEVESVDCMGADKYIRDVYATRELAEKAKAAAEQIDKARHDRMVAAGKSGWTCYSYSIIEISVAGEL